MSEFSLLMGTTEQRENVESVDFFFALLACIYIYSPVLGTSLYCHDKRCRYENSRRTNIAPCSRHTDIHTRTHAHERARGNHTSRIILYVMLPEFIYARHPQRRRCTRDSYRWPFSLSRWASCLRALCPPSNLVSFGITAAIMYREARVLRVEVTPANILNAHDDDDDDDACRFCKALPIA